MARKIRIRGAEPRSDSRSPLPEEFCRIPLGGLFTLFSHGRNILWLKVSTSMAEVYEPFDDEYAEKQSFPLTFLVYPVSRKAP